MADSDRDIDGFLASLCQVMANRKRVGLIRVLIQEGEQSVGDLAARLEISDSNTSQHLHVLRMFGLVEVKAVGQTKYYRVKYPELKTCLEELTSMYHRMRKNI